MKKLLSGMCLVAFIIFGFTGQSWAFGWFGHHSNGQEDSSQGSSSSTGNTGNGSNLSGNNLPIDGNGSGNNGNKNFPTAPVPEPMTLSLLGAGLAGIYLKLKNTVK